VFTVQAEDQPSWAEIVRHAEHGESVSVIAHGGHVAEIVPPGELDRLRETIEVLSDSELVRDLREGLADGRDGRVFSAGQIATDLAARPADERIVPMSRSVGRVGLEPTTDGL
jgi:antitoxin (DNA-binding transcriptional repressor) of toxin-antitoxin stability system